MKTQALDCSLYQLAQTLMRNGWCEHDFERNQLLYVYEVLTGRPGRGHIAFRNYWYTVGQLQTLLSSIGMTPIFLKSRRNYPFYDSNVDVLIRREHWNTVVAVLQAEGWALPSKLQQCKQRLIERSKLKLPSCRAGLVAVHLYGAITWRYQSDIGILPMHDGTTKLVELVRLSDACQSICEHSDIEVLMPTPVADLIIHSAHVVYENYRITLGEALYIAYLWHICNDALREIKSLAIQYATLNALIAVRKHIMSKLESPLELDPMRWPSNFRFSVLLANWVAHCKFRRCNSGPLMAAEEMIGYLAHFALCLGKRKLWKILYGRE